MRFSIRPSTRVELADWPISLRVQRAEAKGDATDKDADPAIAPACCFVQQRRWQTLLFGDTEWHSADSRRHF